MKVDIAIRMKRILAYDIAFCAHVCPNCVSIWILFVCCIYRVVRWLASFSQDTFSRE